MEKEIRVIFLEDVPSEASAVECVLRENGFALQFKRVETKEDFVRELESPTRPDVILSDHGLPHFDGFSALAVAQQKCPDVPFIFVTNALDWKMEIDKLASGVTDFVAKRELDLLAPTMRRALFHADLFRRSKRKLELRKQMVKKLLALIREYEPSEGFLPICSNCKKIRDKQDKWHTPEEFFGDRLGLRFTHGICPDCIRKLYGL